MKNAYIFSFFILSLLGVSIYLLSDNQNKIDGNVGEVILYKSNTCGCCGIYYNYLRNNIGNSIKAVNLEDMNAIKEKYTIPLFLQSCHTTIISGYFVEGHIPIEAINKLISEKPNIKGIAMPGMPSGSSGMPGKKIGSFDVFAVSNDGKSELFMSLLGEN